VLPLLLLLDSLPVHQDLGRGIHFDLAEHVRVPADQLRHDPLRHVVDVEGPLLAGHLRVEDHLQEHVAQLVAQPLRIPRVDGLQRLVRLFQQVPPERLVRLLPVPRAPVRAPEPLHHADQFEQPLATRSGAHAIVGHLGVGRGHRAPQPS
jgi:hypothetical protein